MDIDIFEKAAAEIWNSICKEDIEILTVEEADMIIQKNKKVFEVVAKNSICQNILFTGNKHSNLFFCNDSAYGGKCPSCGSDMYFVLIGNGLKPMQNSDYVIFNPSIETYMVRGLEPNREEFAENVPIPIEVDNDFNLLHSYKYRCINCEGWKEFKYDEQLGLI